MADELGLFGGDDPLDLGLEFEEEIKSPKDWLLNPPTDRDPKALKQDFEAMGPLRQIGELAVGTPEALVSMASTIPAMAYGGAQGLYGLAKGEGLEGATNRVREGMEALTYQPRSTAGQLLAHDVGQVFEKGKEFSGDVGAMIPGNEAISRTAGEALFEGGLATAPLLAIRGGIRGRRAAEQKTLADEQAAQELLQRRMAEETAKEDQLLQREHAAGPREFEVDPNQARETQLKADLIDLDNLMINYGKELQAPQLGLGGKVARHEDQLGKREKGEFSSQMAWDEEMRLRAQEQASAERPAQVPSALEAYEPTYEGTTLEHAPSPVRPFQIEQMRPGRISEGEATQIYRTPAFERTTEQRLKLQEYERSLRQGETGGIEPDALSRVSRSARAEQPLGAVDFNIYPKSFQKLRDWTKNQYADDKNILKGDDNYPVIVFRGQHTMAHDLRTRRMGTELFNRTHEGPYAVFVSDNAYLSGAYATPIVSGTEKITPGHPSLTAGAGIAPFVLRPTKVIEFPIGEGGRFNKFAFDAQARRLGKGEVLVARNTYDMGPNSGYDHPLKRDTYKNDQYAFTDPNVAIPLFEGRKQKPLGAENPFFTYNPKLQEMMFEHHNYSTRDMLEHIKNESQTPYYKELAKVLLEDKTYNPRFGIEQRETGFIGNYWPNRYQVTINPRGTGSEGIFLHENIHARTHSAIQLVKRDPTKRPELVAPVKRLIELYKEFDKYYDTVPSQSGLNKPAKPYGLLNEHEFLAEGMTNPDFQALLARTPLPKKIATNRLKTYWDAFVDGLRKILRLPKEANNYLSELITAGGEIMRLADSETRQLHTRGPWKDVLDFSPIGAYSYRDFKKDLEARGLAMSEAQMKAMYEKTTPSQKEVKSHPSADALKVASDNQGLKRIQNEYIDQRSFEEVRETTLQSKDIGDFKKNVTLKALPGRFAGQDNPLTSWASSKAHEIKNRSLQNARSDIHGKSAKHPDPGTYVYAWRQLTQFLKDSLNQFGWKWNNHPTPVPASELAKLTPKQREAYRDKIRINHKQIDMVNAKLRQEGKPLINKLPNYWAPITLDGPFIVKFVDKTGDTKKIIDFYTKPNERKLKKLAAEYGMEAKLMPEKGTKGSSPDWEQFEWILRQMDKESRDAASKAITEGLRRQGFLRHGLKRKGVEGGKGSAPGRKGVRDYEEVSEKYIYRAHDWVANRDIDNIYKQIKTDTALDAKPNAKALSMEMLDTARGGMNEHFNAFSNAVGGILSGAIKIGTLGTVKLPKRFARDLLRETNKINITRLLGFGNLTQLGANILQPGYAIPALMEHAAKAGMNVAQLHAAVFKAMARTTDQMMKWNSGKDIKKLQEIGALDPTVKHDYSTYASDYDPRYSHKAAEHITGISTLGYIEANAVRRPAALMFLEMLREIGYDKVAKSKDEIYYVAKEMTDKYMVSNKFYEKPHMFSRSGIVGTALSPLQSFSTTWLGMLRSYAKLSAEGLLEANVAKSMPLMYFMGLNVLTAGMLGLIGIKEWDFLAHLVNKYTNMNMPSGTEWVMSKFKDTKYRFGLLSDAVGMHVGATMNAPTLTGTFAPGMQFIGDAAKFGATLGQQALSQTGMVNPPTGVELRDAWKGVTPRFNWIDRAGEALGLGSTGLNWADIEEKYTPPGMPYQDLAGRAGPVTRTEEDKFARKLGTYTTREAEEKTEYFINERSRKERASRFGDNIKTMADIITRNPTASDLMDQLEPIIQRIEKEQAYTGQQIKTALKNSLRDKMIEVDERRAHQIQRIIKSLGD